MANLEPAPYDLWDAHVHPLVALNDPDKDLLDALGTAFIVHNVVLCCWHQVAAAIEQGVQPGLAANDPAGGHPFVPLNFRRPTRHDLAVAALPDGLPDAGKVYLLQEHPAEGTDLFSYGYPMPDSGEKIDARDARSTIVVGRRLLRGYTAARRDRRARYTTDKRSRTLQFRAVGHADGAAQSGDFGVAGVSHERRAWAGVPLYARIPKRMPYRSNARTSALARAP